LKEKGEEYLPLVSSQKNSFVEKAWKDDPSSNKSSHSFLGEVVPLSAHLQSSDLVDTRIVSNSFDVLRNLIVEHNVLRLEDNQTYGVQFWLPGTEAEWKKRFLKQSLQEHMEIMFGDHTLAFWKSLLEPLSPSSISENEDLQKEIQDALGQLTSCSPCAEWKYGGTFDDVRVCTHSTTDETTSLDLKHTLFSLNGTEETVSRQKATFEEWTKVMWFTEASMQIVPKGSDLTSSSLLNQDCLNKLSLFSESLWLQVQAFCQREIQETKKTMFQTARNAQEKFQKECDKLLDKETLTSEQLQNKFQAASGTFSTAMDEFTDRQKYTNHINESLKTLRDGIKNSLVDAYVGAETLRPFWISWQDGRIRDVQVDQTQMDNMMQASWKMVRKWIPQTKRLAKKATHMFSGLWNKVSYGVKSLVSSSDQDRKQLEEDQKNITEEQKKKRGRGNDHMVEERNWKLQRGGKDKS